MFLRMLVPLDGSPLAERALDLAASLARQTAASAPRFEPLVILFRAVDRFPWLDLDNREEARAQALSAATRYLDGQAECLRREDITVETAVRLGNPAEEILEQAVARQVELIVMSTHGRAGLARWALGSVAERVARAAPVPVLLLPDAATATSLALAAQRPETIPQLLVPLDGSARAEAALPAAIELARVLHAAIRLLSIFAPRCEESALKEAHRTWDAGRRRVHQVERYLMRQAEIVQRAGVRARWSFGYGQPGAEIIETARRQQVSVVVMTTHGRGGLVRWRLGSVTEEMLHDGGLPVLLVPSAQAESQAAPEAQEPPIGANGALR